MVLRSSERFVVGLTPHGSSCVLFLRGCAILVPLDKVGLSSQGVSVLIVGARCVVCALLRTVKMAKAFLASAHYLYLAGLKSDWQIAKMI